MTNDDMPSYVQYPNACGLTSLLMALKPESRNMAPLFDKIWNKIKILFYPNGNNTSTAYYYNWQRVLEYLLFQVVKNDELQKMLEKNFGNALNEAMIPIIEYGINQVQPYKKKQMKRKQISYDKSNEQTEKEEDKKEEGKKEEENSNAENKEQDKSSEKDEKEERILKEEQKRDNEDSEKTEKDHLEIDGRWIMRRVNVWKKDIELEILANLFGCTFIPWKKTEDGTGAIFFNQKDFTQSLHEDVDSSEPKNDFKEKVDFLIQIVNSGGPVICCAGFHWLAIKEIIEQGNKYLVKYHDPASGHEFTRSLNRFRDVERFYSFKFSESDRLEREKLLNQILFYLN